MSSVATHEPGREGVGKHVTDKDAPVQAAECDGRLDELALPDRQDLAADHAGVHHPGRDADHDDDVAQARPEHADDRDGEEDERKGQLDVGQPHQEVVHAPAEVAGREPDGHAEKPGDQHGREPHHQRDTGAVDDSREDVAAQVIRAQHVKAPAGILPAGFLEALADLLLERVEGGHDGRQERREDHRGHDRETEQRGPAPDQAPQQGYPLALGPGTLRRQRHDGCRWRRHLNRILGSR
jgi:hypothetical protein